MDDIFVCADCGCRPSRLPDIRAFYDRRDYWEREVDYIMRIYHGWTRIDPTKGDPFYRCAECTWEVTKPTCVGEVPSVRTCAYYSESTKTCHYYPPKPGPHRASERVEVGFWCGKHSDFQEWLDRRPAREED